MKLIPLALIISCFSFSCRSHHDKERNEEIVRPFIIEDSVGVLTDLKRGDVLVKPNHNWLPGTVWVEGGNGFGHAAIVLEGATGSSTLEVLSSAIIFESHARDVPAEFQLRSVKAYQPGTDFRTDNITFAPVRFGKMYRLRFNLTHGEIESLMAYILKQDKGVSSWRSLKSGFQDTNDGTFDHRTHWYCSHLIREAFLQTIGIDLDSNGGLIVYPNDLIGYSQLKSDSIMQRFRF